MSGILEIRDVQYHDCRYLCSRGAARGAIDNPPCTTAVGVVVLLTVARACVCVRVNTHRVTWIKSQLCLVFFFLSRRKRDAFVYIRKSLFNFFSFAESISRSAGFLNFAEFRESSAFGANRGSLVELANLSKYRSSIEIIGRAENRDGQSFHVLQF